MTVYEYLDLKKQKIHLVQSIKNIKEQTARTKSMIKRLEYITELISDAEKTSNIKKYRSMVKSRAKIRAKITLYKRKGKNTTSLIKQEMSLGAEINKAAEPAFSGAIGKSIKSIKSINSTPVVESSKIAIQPVQPVQPTTEPAYYIINLAWSGESGDHRIINTVEDYINMSNYISRDAAVPDGRGGHMMTWKYSFDTIEEQAQIKALRMAASHMLDVFKKWSNERMNAEIFGKIQKF